jgi:hypothetical protein
MALIWASATAAPAALLDTPSSGAFSWDAWYAKNKQRLAAKRAKRYAEDPAYREAALRRSREQRHKDKTPVLDGTTIAFKDMAQALGVTTWVLREWRRKNYFPEPVNRDGRLWFHPDQRLLLQGLVSFFGEHGSRLDAGSQRDLDLYVSTIFANWQ